MDAGVRRTVPLHRQPASRQSRGNLPAHIRGAIRRSGQRAERQPHPTARHRADRVLLVEEHKATSPVPRLVNDLGHPAGAAAREVGPGDDAVRVESVEHREQPVGFRELRPVRLLSEPLRPQAGHKLLCQRRPDRALLVREVFGHLDHDLAPAAKPTVHQAPRKHFDFFPQLGGQLRDLQFVRLPIEVCAPGKERLDRINAELNGLHAIENRLNAPDQGRHQAFLIGLDINGNGKAVVSSGNPDTAANVATYVPGTGSELAKISGDMDRSDRMVNAAGRAGSPSTAVVTWIGYDAPPGITDAGSESYADNGKGGLSSFQDGLRATHQGELPSHNTVLGHSYGTTVVGHAARDGGLNADDLVFVASPGVGVNTANQLHLDGVDQAQIGQHVHSTVAEHDMINVTKCRHRPRAWTRPRHQ